MATDSDNPTPPPSSPRVLFEADADDDFHAQFASESHVVRLRIIESTTYWPGFVLQTSSDGDRWRDMGSPFGYTVCGWLLLRALAARDAEIERLKKEPEPSDKAFRALHNLEQFLGEGVERDIEAMTPEEISAECDAMGFDAKRVMEKVNSAFATPIFPVTPARTEINKTWSPSDEHNKS